MQDGKEKIFLCMHKINAHTLDNTIGGSKNCQNSEKKITDFYLLVPIDM